MKKWAALLLLSLVVVSGYAIAPNDSSQMVQASAYVVQDEDLPYCH
ncbi:MULTISPECIES: hypothetical protein [Bacillales]|nr:hypothetical protein [Pseudalkalibacillus hwajinpoensis]MBF0708566.1 hypothetical protein [Pseudalkalibacillus hwajinpoensis]WLR59865.1 hypothetical protein LC071_00135 [Pseudalkalibacillus hwajinpoensis]